jgi:RNA polymerase sigma-70 factor (ECF subfamily)
MEGLTQVLAEDVVMVSDGGGKRTAALRPLVGRQRVAKLAIGGTRAEPVDRAQIVILNAIPALAIWSNGELRSLFFMDVNEEGQVSHIFAIRNPDKLVEAERAAAAGSSYSG